ncbi:tyrosine-type recombinase/integrase [Agromyces sp. NPDC060279]|uniref:tyrosine-type recombinase/integrase n=1 Tax=Agromyces sp. NPDC060279 TaxID=3347092 RepID=UPI0036511FA0
MSTPKRYPGTFQRHGKNCARSAPCRCPWAYTAEATKAGRRAQITKSGFTSARAAATARAEALAELRSNPLTKRGQTVEAALEAWLDRKVAAGALRPSTEQAYRHHVRVYLVPILGKVKLSDLHVGHLDHLQAEVQRMRPSMSAATRTRNHATLRSALRDAYRRGEIADAPTRRMEPIRAPRPKVKVWQPEQFGRFLDWLEAGDDRLAPAVHLAGMTGLRRGELCGLRWLDVDLERGRLVVAQQVVQLGREQHVGAPKTAAGELRVVDLDAETVAVLRRVQAQQERERAEWGEAYVDLGLVLTWQDGRPFIPEDLTRRFPKAVRRFNDELAAKLRGEAHESDPTLVGAPLPLVRFHDLRHLQASLLLAAGVPLALVSKRLGHSSVQVTSDTYAHMLEGVGTQAAAAAAALIPRRSADVP